MNLIYDKRIVFASQNSLKRCERPQLNKLSDIRSTERVSLAH